MKTRIKIFENDEANLLFLQRRKRARLIINFNVLELRDHPDLENKLTSHLAIRSYQFAADQTFRVADIEDMLEPLRQKLQLDNNDVIDVVLRKNDDKSLTYFLQVHAHAYRSERDSQRELKGQVELAYWATFDKQTLTANYDLVTFDTDNVCIFNAVNNATGITDEDIENYKENFASEEEKLEQAIKHILPGNQLLQARAQEILEQVREFKVGNTDAKDLNEFDKVLSCTREFILSEPYCKAEHALLLPSMADKTENIAKLAAKYQRHSTRKILTGILIGLLAAALIAASIAAIVMTFGAAAIPITILTVATIAGGVASFSLFKCARPDYQLQKSLVELQTSVAASPPPSPTIV